MLSSLAITRFIPRLLIAASAASALSLLHLASASAGEYFEKDGVAIRGQDPVAYFTDNKAVNGLPEFKAEHKGSTFLFASAAHRDLFVANPEKYAPQYGGFCAYGTASGYKAATSADAFTIIDGKLYLNYNRDVQKKWSGDVPGYLAKADKAWPEASKTTKVHE